ncbi:MAG: DUF3035 domain-containing protein [Magnetospirillum sp. WYHS-4]
MMRNGLFGIAAAGLAIGLLGGCEGVKDTLGMTKHAPDEFAVYRRAPLSVPPDSTLRPPEPGAAPTQNVDPRRDARSALTGNSSSRVAVQGASPGLQALMKRTGVNDAEAGIRETINRETSILAEEDKAFTEKIMFWDKSPEKAKTVDPTKENKRIQENQALGKPVNEGDSASIERKQKGLLEGLFK